MIDWVRVRKYSLALFENEGSVQASSELYMSLCVLTDLPLGRILEAYETAGKDSAILKWLILLKAFYSFIIDLLNTTI